ncbi:hypothetical protein MMC31_002814 [Peltigera leucophlebia]|nr:hypothetical protein [Peltigera leucophlebia]
MSAPHSTFPPGYLDEYIGFKLLWFSSASIAINICFVGLRFYARYVGKTSLGADDYITILSLVFAVAIGAIGVSFVNYAGVGYHFAAILLRAPTKPLLLLKISYVFAVINCFSVMFPKLAMLCFFLRIFIERWHRVTCYILMGVLVATAVATLAANLAQCIPLKVLWGTTEAAEKCINQQLLWALSSLPNIITDLIMLALPVPVIWKIQLSWKDKVGLMLTFGTGSIGTITSILRFLFFLRYTGPAADSDPTWNPVELVIYSITEVTVYTIASCLPIYRSLYLSIRRQKPTPEARLPARLKRYGCWHLLPGVGSRYKSEKTEAVDNGPLFYPNDQRELNIGIA